MSTISVQTITLIGTISGKRDGTSAACTSSELQIGSKYDLAATVQRPSHRCEKQTWQIQDLEEQIHAIRASSTAKALETSTDRIFADLNRNKEQAPSAKRIRWIH
jgi:biopolymer transport protein ExbB/TolQ